MPRVLLTGVGALISVATLTVITSTTLQNTHSGADIAKIGAGPKSFQRLPEGPEWRSGF
jgi:hypothetical protein